MFLLSAYYWEFKARKDVTLPVTYQGIQRAAAEPGIKMHNCRVVWKGLLCRLIQSTVAAK